MTNREKLGKMFSPGPGVPALTSATALQEQLSRLIVFLDSARPPLPLEPFLVCALSPTEGQTTPEAQQLLAQLTKQGEALELAPTLTPEAVCAVLFHCLTALNAPIIPPASYDVFLLSRQFPDRTTRIAYLRTAVDALPDLLASDFLSLLAKWCHASPNQDESRKQVAALVWHLFLRPRDQSAKYVNADGHNGAVVETLSEMLIACDEEANIQKHYASYAKKLG